MEKVFEIHAHCLFPIKISRQVEIYKKEMEATGIEKICFLSIPNDVKNMTDYHLDLTQNIKVLFLKHVFGEQGYAFAGLEHPIDSNAVSKQNLSESFLKQAKEYYENGYDGIKMLEGYPTVRKHDGISLDDEVYDKFYDFLQRNEVPIIMHVANPIENWDIKKASKYAIAQGRVYDGSYPTKNQLDNEMRGILIKFPNLKLGIAHFGFMSHDIKQAEEFLSYKNTFIDITPGGEQLIEIAKNWGIWKPFFEKYKNRIVYGTDFYAFPDEDKTEWITCFTRRPNLVRQLFETDTEHEYLECKFTGISLDKSLRDKIYYDNAIKIIGDRKPINIDYLIKKATDIQTATDKYAKFFDEDMKFIATYNYKKNL